MTTSEKVAYLKGLADGLGLDKENKQDKLLSAIIDVLETISLDIEELEENALDLGEEIDALSEDLEAVEELVYEEYADDDFDLLDEDEGGCCCGHDHHDHHDHGHDGCCGGHHGHEHDGCCGGHHHGDPVFYEVTCPACENTITVDEDVLNLGKIECPNCGETLEFDLDSIEYDEESPTQE